MNNNIVNNCLLGHYYYKYMVDFIVILLLTYEFYNALIKTHVIFKNKNGKKLHVFLLKLLLLELLASIWKQLILSFSNFYLSTAE